MWIERKIKSCGLQEGLDYWSNLAKSTGGRPAVEYQITIDAAKHMAMTEHTEIGKQVRQYFIEVEKLARKAYDLYQVPQTFSEALRLAADEHDKRLLAEVKVQETEAKVKSLEKENYQLDNLIAATEAENNILRSQYLKRAEVENIVRRKCNCSGNWYSILVRNLAQQGYISKCKGYGYIQLKGHAYFEYVKGSTKIRFKNTKATISWLNSLNIDIDAPKVC